MGALTALVHVATSALAADQTALSATADNISNQNTDGYVRRTVQWNTGDTVQVGSVSSSSGVRATVTAQRDRVLQRSVQGATSTAAASSARLTFVDALQALFTIDSSGNDAAGLGAAIGGVFTAASTLATSPSDSTAKQALFTAAQTFVQTVQRTSGQLQTQAEGLNSQIAAALPQVNDLASQVAALNQQIGANVSDNSTSTLVDQRDLLITKLSSLIDVHPINTSDGAIGLSLSDGISLVSGGTAHPLSASTSSGKVLLLSDQSADVTAAIHGGSVGGALQARDVDLTSVHSALDTIVSSIMNAINAQNKLGTTASGAAGTAIFSGTTADSVTLLASDGNAFAGSADGSNAQGIAALASKPLANGQAFGEAFSSMVTALGQVASTAKTTSTADRAVLSQTSTQLATLSGVSLDEEAANLTQFQRSYQAAAKVLAIANELMAQAINLGQQTTVA